jgi:hypothetical protein
MTVSIVPGIESNRAVYQVLDDLGRYGRVWTELGKGNLNVRCASLRSIPGKAGRVM